MHLLYNGWRQLSQWQSTMPCAIEANYQDADVFLQFEGNGQQGKSHEIACTPNQIDTLQCLLPLWGRPIVPCFLGQQKW